MDTATKLGYANVRKKQLLFKKTGLTNLNVFSFVLIIINTLDFTLAYILLFISLP